MAVSLPFCYTPGHQPCHLSGVSVFSLGLFPAECPPAEFGTVLTPATGREQARTSSSFGRSSTAAAECRGNLVQVPGEWSLYREKQGATGDRKVQITKTQSVIIVIIVAVVAVTLKEGLTLAQFKLELSYSQGWSHIS